MQFPEPPLFAVDEIVYLDIPGQTLPAGPFMISASLGDKLYKIKRVDTGEEHPTSVAENRLKVPAT